MGHIVEVIGIGMVKFGDNSGRKKSHKTLKIRAGKNGAPGDAGRPVAITLRCARIDGRMQKLVERQRIDAQHRFVLRDQPFVGELDRDAQCGLGGALARAGLQHPQLALLDGEFEILHVAVMALRVHHHLAYTRAREGPRCGPGRRRFIFCSMAAAL